MNKVESRAEIFLMALHSLSKQEREAVIARLLDDPDLREDLMDIALIRQREGEPSRPFTDYLVDKRIRQS